MNKDDENVKVPQVNKFTSKVELWDCSVSGSTWFVAELYHLAICTDVVSVSFRVLQRATERVVPNKYADIYSIKTEKSFSMNGLGLHLGSVHVAFWKLT